jgi:hypothetical protein
MQRMTSWARLRGTINQQAAARLLCVALAGFGTVLTAAPAGAGEVALAAAPLEVGCASVNQATVATITRYRLASIPGNAGTGTHTQRNATKVRALFRDICAAMARAGLPQPGLTCVAGAGNSYRGTFYAGKRVLATFSYSLRGCPQLTLTAAGKTRATFVIGKVAAAAPHLKADVAAVLGVPVSQV